MRSIAVHELPALSIYFIMVHAVHAIMAVFVTYSHLAGKYKLYCTILFSAAVH